MIFQETPLAGAYVIDIQRLEDERGFFARTWCQREYAAHGLNPSLAQCSISFNKQKGTLRGMHYQLPPHAEAKVVRCTRGAIFDVIIDLRPESPTYKQHFGLTLTPENHTMLYVPERCAHGLLTLADETEVLYLISEFYAPEQARGVRWNDPAFAIQWPETVQVISERDTAYPDFIGI